MPMDNPDLATVAVSTGAGALGSTIVVLGPKEMSRREAAYTLLGGTSISAFIPPMLVSYLEWPWFCAGGVGLICGLSVIGLIPLLSAAGTKLADWFIKSKTGSGGNQ